LTYYVPGTEEKDPAKVIMSLQQAHTKTATNTTDIATNTANIATNTANIVTNTANIATNTSNIATQTAALAALTGSKITASLGSDVALNNTANYFDGPSVAQGATGTWFVIANVTCSDTAGAANFFAKLWDGTTVIDSGNANGGGANIRVNITLAGVITSPVGNLKISVRDPDTTTGKIEFNRTGNSKDATITAFRIA
jgi:hypothetical protein